MDHHSGALRVAHAEENAAQTVKAAIINIFVSTIDF